MEKVRKSEMAGQQTKISVKVLPNAGKNEITGTANDVWRIKIAAAPDKGKANKELIDFLSEVLRVRKDSLSIFKGHTSHNKVISVEGLTADEVNERLAAPAKGKK